MFDESVMIQKLVQQTFDESVMIQKYVLQTFNEYVMIQKMHFPAQTTILRDDFRMISPSSCNNRILT